MYCFIFSVLFSLTKCKNKCIDVTTQCTLNKSECKQKDVLFGKNTANPYFRHSAFVSFGTDHRLEMELDFASLAKHEQDCY